jgi:hypothetical protein
VWPVDELGGLTVRMQLEMSVDHVELERCLGREPKLLSYALGNHYPTSAVDGYIHGMKLP